MSFQYTYDGNGKPVGVFVPINEWEKLTGELEKIKTAGRPSSPVLKSLERALKQVEAVKKGKAKSIPLQQLLDEL